MQEYYRLQRTLQLITLATAGIVFVPVWLFGSFNMAWNYWFGAIVGVVYLRLLARDVERLGQQQTRLGTNGLAVFALLIIVTSKWEQLHLFPVFLGFLTYKAAVVWAMLQQERLRATQAKKSADVSL